MLLRLRLRLQRRKRKKAKPLNHTLKIARLVRAFLFMGINTMFDFFLLILAAFGAGVLNTIAGGGTFLTFPALVAVGMPPVAANATSAVAVFPGYLAGAIGFRAEVRSFDRPLIQKLCLVTLLGGAIGSILLIYTPNTLFAAVVPILLLASTLAFLFGENIRKWAQVHSGNDRSYGSVGMALVGIYGGYFNGGLGIVLLALFSLWGMQNIHKMNALKNALSFVLSATSVLIFSLAGIVNWKFAVIMMIAASIGGYAGAPIARAIPKHVVRYIVAAVGLGMTAIFTARLF